MLFRSILSLWLLGLLPVGAMADSAADARKPVERLNNTLIEVMKGGALGTHWKKLEQPQKLAFMDKLTDLSVATYAAQFKEYGGESFQFDSGQDIKNGRLLLRYNLVAPKEKPIRFEYFVGQFNGQWHIINIVVDGISDLALKKAQYTSVIDREGFDALLNKLTQKIADYAKNNA